MTTSQSAGMQGVAPIFGSDPCSFISGGRHVTFPMHDFGSNLSQGFSLALDVQPETRSAAFLLGTGISGKTSLILHYNADDVKNQIRLELSDDGGRMICACAQLSKYVSKRLYLTVDVSNCVVIFYEFNLFDDLKEIETLYIKREGPRSFNRFTYDMILGGACVDGNIQASISAKLGNFAVWNRVLQEHELNKLSDSSRRQVEIFNGNALYLVDESKERRAVFRDDMRKLHEWVRNPRFSGADTREAANMLYRWLLDTQPMLQDLCNELGIQLSLPGASEKEKDYNEMEIHKEAVFLFTMTLGKRGLFGYQWVTRKEFLQNTVLVIKGTQIRVDAFVKFVRNKLGGGHLDARERKKWQRELFGMSRYYEEDSDFLNHHMREVLRAVWEGVQENRIEQHAR